MDPFLSTGGHSGRHVRDGARTWRGCCRTPRGSSASRRSRSRARRSWSLLPSQDPPPCRTLDRPGYLMPNGWRGRSSEPLGRRDCDPSCRSHHGSSSRRTAGQCRSTTADSTGSYSCLHNGATQVPGSVIARLTTSRVISAEVHVALGHRARFAQSCPRRLRWPAVFARPVQGGSSGHALQRVVTCQRGTGSWRSSGSGAFSCSRGRPTRWCAIRMDSMQIRQRLRDDDRGGRHLLSIAPSRNECARS